MRPHCTAHTHGVTDKKRRRQHGAPGNKQRRPPGSSCVVTCLQWCRLVRNPNPVPQSPHVATFASTSHRDGSTGYKACGSPCKSQSSGAEQAQRDRERRGAHRGNHSAAKHDPRRNEKCIWSDTDVVLISALCCRCARSDRVASDGSPRRRMRPFDGGRSGHLQEGVAWAVAARSSQIAFDAIIQISGRRLVNTA